MIPFSAVHLLQLVDVLLHGQDVGHDPLLRRVQAWNIYIYIYTLDDVLNFYMLVEVCEELN